MQELNAPEPNRIAMENILNHTDWFFDEFLQKEGLNKVRDGKLPAELICKALDRVLNVLNYKKPISFVDTLYLRRSSS